MFQFLTDLFKFLALFAVCLVGVNIGIATALYVGAKILL